MADVWARIMASLLNILGKILGGAPSAGSGDPREAIRPVWTALVSAARTPRWYVDGGVEDSKSGRFDILSTLLALALLRLERAGDYAQQGTWLAELFVDDMDAQLREDGIGDLVVGKHVTRLMGTLGGRLGSLRDALASVDRQAAIIDYASRNVNGDEARRTALASMLGAWSDGLDGIDPAALLAGQLPA